MARSKAKTRSSKKSSARGKSRGGFATPTKAIMGSERNDSGLSESALTRVSDKLGIPVSQLSHVVETIGQIAQEIGDTARIIDEYKGNEAARVQMI